MTSKERHQKVANEFSKLNSELEKTKDNYLEKISSTINKAVKNHDDKDLWKSSYDKIVDLFYAALTDTYLKTSITLKKIYNQISDKIPNIEDFIYQDDDITLSERIKQYWDDSASSLKNPEADTKTIALHLLTMYERILNNEMINVKQGVKKIKKPIDNDGINIIVITNGECCTNGGVYLEDEAPELPPYHINCQCDYWYETYYPTDDADLEELQELGWEEDDE